MSTYNPKFDARYIVLGNVGRWSFTARRAAEKFARELVRNGGYQTACVEDCALMSRDINTRTDAEIARYALVNGKCRKVPR